MYIHYRKILYYVVFCVKKFLLDLILLFPASARVFKSARFNLPGFMFKMSRSAAV